MRKYWFALALLLASGTEAVGQVDSTRSAVASARNVIYVELAGSAPPISLNFERLLSERLSVRVGYRAGADPRSMLSLVARSSTSECRSQQAICAVPKITSSSSVEGCSPATRRRSTQRLDGIPGARKATADSHSLGRWATGVSRLRVGLSSAQGSRPSSSCGIVIRRGRPQTLRFYPG